MKNVGQTVRKGIGYDCPRPKDEFIKSWWDCELLTDCFINRLGASDGGKNINDPHQKENANVDHDQLNMGIIAPLEN